MVALLILGGATQVRADGEDKVEPGDERDVILKDMQQKLAKIEAEEG